MLITFLQCNLYAPDGFKGGHGSKANGDEDGDTDDEEIGETEVHSIPTCKTG